MFCVIFFSACSSEEVVVVFQENESAEIVTSSPTPSPEEPEILRFYPELPGKIAIIANEWLVSSLHFQSHGNWVLEILERYGEENIIIYSWEWNENYDSIVNEISGNSEISVLIYDYGIGAIEDIQKQRDDIFLIYIDYYFPAGIDLRADLVLEVDSAAIARNFPAMATEMGAQTLIYFYEGFEWVSDEDKKDFEEYAENERLSMNFMRELCAEIGLGFAAVDINGAIECGSSYDSFMTATIPPLIEQYGTDIVLFGLDNERVHWSWCGLEFIYLPLYSNWFEPHPADIGMYEVRLSDDSPYYETENLPALIDELKNNLAERNMNGRIATYPISMKFLFPIAAAEYGIMQMNGEVSGVDMHVLENIIVGLIAEYTAIPEHGITLSAFEADGVTYENYVLVLPDYLIY
jgi:hypothetical protein